MNKESLVRALVDTLVKSEEGKEFNLLEKDEKHFITLQDAGIDLYTALKENLEFTVFEAHKNTPYICLKNAIWWHRLSSSHSNRENLETLKEIKKRIRKKEFKMV